MVLSLKNISYSYSSDIEVIKNVSLSVGEGEVVALIGESGSGKSTLLHLASGYITPTSGQVSLLGHMVDKPNIDCMVMFQNDFLYPWLSVIDNIKLGMGITKRAVPHSYINQLVGILGLSALINKKPWEISGGQRQRVAFARSLALSPSVLALDEPFSALDPHTREKLQFLIRKTILKINKSLLLVSHNIEEVVRMADRVLILKNGTIDSNFKIELSESERAEEHIVKKYEKKIHRSLVKKTEQENENVQILYHI